MYEPLGAGQPPYRLTVSGGVSAGCAGLLENYAAVEGGVVRQKRSEGGRVRPYGSVVAGVQVPVGEVSYTLAARTIPGATGVGFEAQPPLISWGYQPGEGRLLGFGLPAFGGVTLTERGGVLADFTALYPVSVALAYFFGPEAAVAAAAVGATAAALGIEVGPNAGVAVRAPFLRDWVTAPFIYKANQIGRLVRDLASPATDWLLDQVPYLARQVKPPRDPVLMHLDQVCFRHLHPNAEERTFDPIAAQRELLQTTEGRSKLLELLAGTEELAAHAEADWVKHIEARLDGQPSPHPVFGPEVQVDGCSEDERAACWFDLTTPEGRARTIGSHLEVYTAAERVGVGAKVQRQALLEARDEAGLAAAKRTYGLVALALGQNLSKHHLQAFQSEPGAPLPTTHQARTLSLPELPPGERVLELDDLLNDVNDPRPMIGVQDPETGKRWKVVFTPPGMIKGEAISAALLAKLGARPQPVATTRQVRVTGRALLAGFDRARRMTNHDKASVSSCIRALKRRGVDQPLRAADAKDHFEHVRHQTLIRGSSESLDDIEWVDLDSTVLVPEEEGTRLGPCPASVTVDPSLGDSTEIAFLLRRWLLEDVSAVKRGELVAKQGEDGRFNLEQIYPVATLERLFNDDKPPRLRPGERRAPGSVAMRAVRRLASLNLDDLRECVNAGIPPGERATLSSQATAFLTTLVDRRNALVESAGLAAELGLLELPSVERAPLRRREFWAL